VKGHPSPRRRIFRGTASPDDRRRNPYLLLPFEVPQGTKAIGIRYDYDRENNTLDLGLFDPRGHEFPAACGFRGWSGSARDRVVIGEHWATPGYLPGPIYPGTWHVILGLYRVSDSGCDYEVEIELLPEGPTSHPAPVVPEAPESGPHPEGWVKGDLHCHTHHSDAEGSVQEVARAAGEKGLHFLAITDHNTVSQWGEIEVSGGKQSGVVLLPGEEITTYWGHANVWGPGRWLDFRCRHRKDIKAICDLAHGEGRPFSINHPKPNGPAWEFGFDLPFDCIEVWHGLWALGNEHSLRVWEDLLRRGRRAVAVGGSDAHPRFNAQGRLIEWIGRPTTWVWTEGLSAEAILAGIRAGHVSISACPEGPLVSIAVIRGGDTFRQGESCPFAGEAELEVEVWSGEGLELVLVSGRGELARKRVMGNRWQETMPVDLEKEGYVRAELRVPVPASPPGRWPMAALSNPVWYEPFLADKIRDLWRGR